MVSIPLSRMSAPNAIKTPAMLGNQPRLYRGGEVIGTAPLFRKHWSINGNLQNAGMWKQAKSKD